MYVHMAVVSIPYGVWRMAYDCDMHTWMFNVQSSSVILAPLCSYSIRLCSPNVL